VLEINGRSLENATHQHIIQYIHQVWSFTFPFTECGPKSPVLILGVRRQSKRESSFPTSSLLIIRCNITPNAKEIHDVIVFSIRAKDFLIIIILFSCFSSHLQLLALTFRCDDIIGSHFLYPRLLSLVSRLLPPSRQ
jgi:hypothetical protein